MPLPSLKSLALAACLRNIRHIEDVGDYPYKNIRELLLKIESPAQLRLIETNSPQICETDTEANDAELWMRFMKSDIPQWNEIWTNAEERPKLGWDLYIHCKKHVQEQIEKDKGVLQAKLSAIKEEKAKHETRLVSASELPQQKKRKRNPATSSSIPQASAGKSAMQRIRQQARGAGTAASSRSTFDPKSLHISAAELQRRQEAKKVKENKSFIKRVESIAKLPDFGLMVRKPQTSMVPGIGTKRTATGESKTPSLPVNTDYLTISRSSRPIGVRSKRASPPTKAPRRMSPPASSVDDLFSDAETTAASPPFLVPKPGPPAQGKASESPSKQIPSPRGSPDSKVMRDVAGKPTKIIRRAKYDPLMKPRRR